MANDMVLNNELLPMVFPDQYKTEISQFLFKAMTIQTDNDNQVPPARYANKKHHLGASNTPSAEQMQKFESVLKNRLSSIKIAWKWHEISLRLHNSETYTI